MPSPVFSFEYEGNQTNILTFSALFFLMSLSDDNFNCKYIKKIKTSILSKGTKILTH
jgi:hypothetical protein